MMATEIIEIDASWAEKWTKSGVPFLSSPTVYPDLAQLVGTPHATRGELTQTLWPAVVPIIDYCSHVLERETTLR